MRRQECRNEEGEKVSVRLQIFTHLVKQQNGHTQVLRGTVSRKGHMGTSKNRFFASFAQSLRPLRLKEFGLNRKVRHGLRKVRKVQIGYVSAPSSNAKIDY